ncbi:hypothetical protein NW754_011436 [Fusarium falciforme]|uniref:MARVEL domain-containing protein n=1 Tax=Fusarium falciforme TaxID=195108 RepID=A0A9W8QY80_9HYPO|nr:Hypothetical protein NCS54_01118500 [Fusarium falciforme]KAJ4167618.1 hypothetical protein NW754_011436 [Fusarium falciforme]KAJ4182331.1 hypothetical protein NW755_010380 [Fusarium falciforme]KAJ4191162.1 hypothetical protein NW767_010957 [Fusarium falciforme]KAJ4237596.1 hypothetical protein NW757_013245 [Fusarium falciforme]WAO93633.1 Hypothetical protein NCS54_01118500 [Fusarium falciforme]
MFFALLFVFFRVLQIVTLIPCMGMLAWFVDGFVKQNALTPDSILILFIVSVLALAWTLFTLFSYHRSSTNAHFVAFVDILFFGAFIAAVYYLRYVRYSDCVSIRRAEDWDVTVGDVRVIGPSYNLVNDKPCSMLKACWAFGIMNIIFFFTTAVVAFMHGGHMSAYDRSHSSRRSYHSSRHSHRSSRSRSGSRYSGSRPHSRRVYV